MRLKQFINEENRHNSFDFVIKELFDKCYPFIKKLNKTKNIDRLLYSGRNNMKDMFIGKVRDDRMPMDTPNDIHEEIDELFRKKYGWYARSNSIFCTGDWQMADHYGLRVYAIFPIGKYKYLWNPNIGDFFSDVVDSGDLSPVDPSEVRDIQEADVEDRAYDLAREAYDEYTYDLDPDEDDIQDMVSWIDDNIEIYLEDVAEEITKENVRENEYIYILENIISGYKNNNLGAALKSNNEIMLNTKKYIAVKMEAHDKNLLRYFNKYGSKKPTKEILEDIQQWD